MGYEWKDSLKGAGQGAVAGSFGGPIGMLIGALAGGAIGGFGDDLDKRITGDSQNNITDQMLSLASMAGGMAGGRASGGMGGLGGMGSGAMSGMPNLEFADGSGRYLAGNAPSGGSFVDGKFLGDLGGMFGGQTTQMPTPNFLSPEELQRQNSMQSFDWSNILKMLGSSGLMGGQEQGQESGMTMYPRSPSFMAPVQTSPVRGEGYYQTWLQKNNLV